MRSLDMNQEGHEADRQAEFSGEEAVHGDEHTSCPDAKTLANRKKKEKKRAAKQQENCLPAGCLGDAGSSTSSVTSPTCGASSSPGSPEQMAMSSPAFAPIPSPCSSPKMVAHTTKGDKKMAVARAAKERVETTRKLEQERVALEEEKQRQLEEEERRKQDAFEAAEQERHRKLEAKHAKVEKAKQEGTFMTKAQKDKAKAQAARAAQIREQLGFPPQDRTPMSSPMASPCMKPKSPPVKLAADPSEAHNHDIPRSESDQITMVFEFEVVHTKRSPIVCVMGHVDTGKTKLLDKIRRTNVQDREAGGITQQIGATFFPRDALHTQICKVDSHFDLLVPGLLVIDTPGHESFNNLRSRGSSLCDLAVVVIDIMHGLEAQTVESLKMLETLHCPYIVALNKIDMLYRWSSEQYACSREAVERQEESVQDHFKKRLAEVTLQLNEQGLNASLYWNSSESDDDCVMMVPTSAHTGEGIPDILFTLCKFAQTSLSANLELKEELHCTVMEVKNVDGLGTIIDVILVTGTLSVGDNIVVAGMDGPILTTVRAVLTPQPMKEMRVKSDYVHNTSVSESTGVRLSAPGLEKAVCGSEVRVVREGTDIQELKQAVQSDYKSILNTFEKQSAGVFVKASTQGSLEALLTFLNEMNIPVCEMGIGEVHKKDVKQAATMKEKKRPEYALILAFDVKINAEARKEAKHDGVQIFTADIIYHLLDQFKLHLEKVGVTDKPALEVIFPSLLQVVSRCDTKSIKCEVLQGHLRTGTPLCYLASDGPEGNAISVGRVVEIQKDRQVVNFAYANDRVCVRVEGSSGAQSAELTFGVHDQLCSHVTQASIETLREHYKGEMRHADWALLDKLRKVLLSDRGETNEVDKEKGNPEVTKK